MPFAALRQSLRALRRVPGLTTISVLTVALGVGPGTSLFSVVKAVLLNPLPYPRADRLAWIAEVNGGFRDNNVSYPDFEDFRRYNRSFSAMAAFATGQATLGTDTPSSRQIAIVSGDFFDALDVPPILGRTFSPAEQLAKTPSGIILGYELWQAAYGGERGILGRTVLLEGLAVKIIGIMPPRFAFPDRTEIWAPMFERNNNRTAHNYRVIGRLRPGASLEQAQEDLSAMARRIKLQFSNPFQSEDAAVVSLYSHIVRQVRPALLVLFAAVGFLLLIVCANVANLLFVQVTGRARELAVRAALGAARRQLLGQMLTESLALAIAGGLLGLLFASWSIEALKLLLPANVPRLGEIRMDAGVVAFAIVISAAAGILFGALPAWRASGLNVNDMLRAGSRSYTANRESHRTQAALVVSEVALSLVLVAGAGLLAQSFWKLRAVDPGFQPDHVLAADVSFPALVPDTSSLIGKHRESLRQLRSIPGVQASGGLKNLPLGLSFNDGFFRIEGRQGPEDADAVYQIASPGALQALRIPLLRGRDFTDADTEASNPVAIVNAEMVRRYFPGVDPLGRRIWFSSFEPGQPLWVTIVGIAADVKQYSLNTTVRPQAYVCYAQVKHTNQLGSTTLVVRTPLDPASLASAIRARLQAVDPTASVGFRTMESVMAAAVARERFQAQVLVAFALLALALASVGLYGVLSYSVSSKRLEIGIRLALGAQPRDVFKMITGGALRLALLGSACGLAGWIAVRKLLAALLFGIGPGDPATLAGAAVLLFLTACAASALPAFRAARVDPATMLRQE